MNSTLIYGRIIGSIPEETGVFVQPLRTPRSHPGSLGIGVLSVFLFACTTESTEDCTGNETEDFRDIRVDFPLPESGVQFRTPDLEIGPYEEVMYCYYDAYQGPAMGVVGMLPMYSNYYGHHLFLKDTKDDDPTPDGTLVDCTSGELSQMREAVFIQAVHNYYPDGSGDWLSLQPGYAFRLEENQRVKIDVHYINTTDEALLTNAAVNLELVPEEDVHTWVGGFDLDLVNFSIPPAELTSISFDCPMPTGASVLSIGGHMHENGESYRVEVMRGEEAFPILEVDHWSEDYRYAPPTRSFWPGDIVIGEGDTIRTTCSWRNTGETALEFPDEMCTTFGVATELNRGLLCENGIIIEDGQ